MNKDCYYYYYYNKRVDVCLLQLVKFASDMAFKRAIKLLKHKDSYRLKEIKKSHGRSLEISLANVTVVGDKAWEVKSANTNTGTYSVSCVLKLCQNENCQERFIECNVCIHQYICNCPDSLITHSICKHIHLVRRYTMGTGEKQIRANNSTCRQNN